MPRKPAQISRKLNHYTKLPVLLDLLRRKKLVLVNPSTWEDRNDADILSEYKKRRKIANLFAVCFAIGDETIHHWKAYAEGISGCCIEFDEKKLLRSFQGISGARWGNVTYKRIAEVEKKPVRTDRIPFVKRWPYRFEREFRILWEGETTQKTIDVDIDLRSINKITLSQKMPAAVFTSIKELLRGEFNDPLRKVNRSTVYENRGWINSFKR